MKIQIISDIHLEFGIRDFDFSDCDLIILAGDTHIGKGIDYKIGNTRVICNPAGYPGEIVKGYKEKLIVKI